LNPQTLERWACVYCLFAPSLALGAWLLGRLADMPGGALAAGAFVGLECAAFGFAYGRDSARTESEAL
jgi:multisubunit Na+/H+ antiporter MnhB subunit